MSRCFELCDGYPRSLRQEFQSTYTPESVNAAAYSPKHHKLYLVERDHVYVYKVSGEIPDLEYTYLVHFSLQDNDDSNNVFCVNSPSSPMRSAPRHITTLVISNDGVLAFSDRQMFKFTPTPLYPEDRVAVDEEFCGGEWEHVGRVDTPCSSCAPVAARSSGEKFYLYYKQQNTTWKFDLHETHGVLEGDWLSEKCIPETYEDICIEDVTAAYRVGHDIYFILGKCTFCINWEHI